MGKRRAKDAEIAAVEELKRKIKIARSKGNFRELAGLHNALGNQYRLMEHLEEALEQHKEEINICLKFDRADRMGLGIAYRNMGEVLMEMKEEERAIEQIKKYLKIATEQENYVEQQRAYITLGRAYLNFGTDEDKSEKLRETSMLEAYNCFKKAWNLTKEDRLRDKLNDEKELAQMKCNNCQNIGLVLDAMDKPKNAEQWLRRAIEIGENHKFHEYLAPCYSVVSSICLKTGDGMAALEAAKNCAKSCKLLGNVTSEVEALILEAKALFAVGDVERGKKILKRLRLRIKKKQELRCYLEELDPLLTAAVKVCKAEDALFITEDQNADRRMKLHETLGDNYSALRNFREAISQYEKSVQCAEKMGITGKKLGSLYFSIAECYKDLEEFDKTHEYYLKDMVANEGNVSEEFRTQTNVASILDKLNKPQEEIIAAHEAAIALAIETKSFSKQVTAIKSFGFYLQSIGKSKEAEKQLARAQEIKEKYNVADEEEESDSQDLLNDNDDDEEEIDLDNLSEDDNSDDEADDDKRNRSKKRYQVRRNELGESQLHLAAKKGDLRRVVKLIREGHPVRIKDSAGWAPLHEAANYGHAKVVDELLKHGAAVDEFGGEGVEDRITPLHDAASNGHCEVMRVLLKHGANVLAKDAKGRYPIDNLIGWRESDGGRDASEEQLEAFEEMKLFLKEKMAKAGKVYGRDRENKVKKLSTSLNRKKGPEMSLLVEKAHDHDCPIPVTIITDCDPDIDNEGGGEKLYKNAMMQFRRRGTDQPKQKGRPREISPGPQGALIQAEQDVNNENNWLLPDDVITTRDNEVVKLGNNSKRKRDSFDFDDVLGDRDRSRSRRRKTSGASHSHSRSSRRISPDPEEMDLDDSEPNHVELENDDDNLDLNSLFNDEDINMDIADVENFLPSQMPPSGRVVEFGTTRDIPIASDDDNDDDDRQSPVLPPRKRKTSHRTSSSVVNLSSDDDDNDFLPSSSSSRRSNANTTKHGLSDIANVLKKVSSEQPRKSLIQSRLPIQVIRNPEISPPENSLSRGMRRTNSTLSIASNTSRSSVQVERQKQEVWRLKIKVLGLGNGEVLLVPVEAYQQNENVEWLASECAARYLRQHGIKPLLSLQTKDGATLTGSDSISLAIGDERELDAIVTGFDQPPLVDRYCSACSDAAIDEDLDIKSGLSICQSSNVLDLTDNNLRGRNGLVLMKTLQRQTSLRVLILSGCSLFDSGVNELCKILPTLSGLTELDLCENGITGYGFTAFSEAFHLDNQPSNPSGRGFAGNVPVGLVSLKLSHNPLGNSIGKALASLLDRLTALKSLEMADCNLTEKIFSVNGNDLIRALSNSRLEEVDISYNKLKTIGLEKFLQCLPARKIKSLKCSSCALKSGDTLTSPEVIAKSISSFLSRNEDCCNLKYLQLNDCGLNDKAMDMILDNFDRLVRLENLEIAMNDGLTASSLISILDRSVEGSLPLQKLDLGSAPNLWNVMGETDERILLALDKKMSSDKKLTYLKLPTCTGNPEPSLGNSQNNLSKLENRVISLMEDYAGNMHFTYEIIGSSIIYRFED